MWIIFVSMIWLSIEPLKIACYDENSILYDFPFLCFDRNITMEEGRNHFASTFKIPDDYFDGRFNTEGWFGYRQIRLRYLYPEMKPLRPHFKKLKRDMRKKYSRDSERNDAIYMKMLSLYISGSSSLIKKEGLLVKSYLTGEILEDNNRYIKYGRSVFSSFDYHYWIKNKKYPYLIGCIKRGQCAIISSFNEKIYYEIHVSNARFTE